MRCEEFLEAYSEILDGDGVGPAPPDVLAHLHTCPRCTRYAQVVEEGCRLVRALPRVQVSERFADRLDHRLLLVDEELRKMRERGTASAATVATAVALAVLLGMVAWSPAVQGRRAPAQVQLPAIVAAPPNQVRAASRRMVLPDPGLRLGRLDALEADLWAARGSLLYEYSPLRARYRTAEFASNGLQ